MRCLDRTTAIAEFDPIESGIKLVAVSGGVFESTPDCSGNDDPVDDGGSK